MTNEDPYGFRERFRNASIEELVAAFNADVGNPGWVSARSIFHSALRDAFLATGLDCSSFIDKGGSISVAHRVRIEGARVVAVPETAPSRPKKKRKVVPRDLVYGENNSYGLVFVEPSTAAELAGFNTAQTWGAFRQAAPSLYQQALELCADLFEDSDAPPDDEPFERTSIPGVEDGDFPDFPGQLMLDVIPESVQQRFGKVVDTALNGPMLELDAKDEDEIIAALRKEGFVCVKRQELIDQLFE